MKKNQSQGPKALNIFSHRKYYAERFLPVEILPMTQAEMADYDWDICDIILITGDAYVDHPSFGVALIGRTLEAQGFRVGIIAQPNWKNVADFRRLGRPGIFFGVTSGNMDSMVNHYTSLKKVRSNDAYSPDSVAGLRPDYAAVVYAQRCREAYPDVPVVLGGIEASLRRFAHWDYWSEKIKRSIVLDAKADVLVYGNGERQIVQIAHELARKKSIRDLSFIRGTVLSSAKSDILKSLPDQHSGPDLYPEDFSSYQVLPSLEEIVSDRQKYAQSIHQIYRETNPYNARPLLQYHGKDFVWANPPALPLSGMELDRIYGLPFSRKAHPLYQGKKLPAFEMIRHSVTIMRGCFGGCSFCSLTLHEGRIVQSRSVQSVLEEIEDIIKKDTAFTGYISDLGGPTANMYRQGCSDPVKERLCRKLSCVYPEICKNLRVDHSALISLYQDARKLPGIKKIIISSGLRYDLALRDEKYLDELIRYHVGGYLKIAPEHISENSLRFMQKPGKEVLESFIEIFKKISDSQGLRQYLVPYFIAGHPGTTLEDMAELALWLKKNDFRPREVQNFLPTPLTISSAMYNTELNLLKKKGGIYRQLPFRAGGEKMQRLFKAFIQYYKKENWPLLRDALTEMGREELIGPGRECLVPRAFDGRKGYISKKR